MSIVQLTRFKSDKSEEMVKTAKAAKAIFEKHGVEFFRMSRFHTGAWAGECNSRAVTSQSESISDSGKGQ